jgi:hypothetical protein
LSQLEEDAIRPSFGPTGLFLLGTRSFRLVYIFHRYHVWTQVISFFELVLVTT